MKSFLSNLLEYSHHCNKQLIKVFNTHPDQVSDKSLRLFSHILNAHQIWNNRIDPQQKAFAVWDFHPTPALQEIHQTNHHHSLQILNTLDPAQVIRFSMRGRVHERPLHDIFFHVINHSTYHRAQIATEFRLAGLEPLVSDYILYPPPPTQP